MEAQLIVAVAPQPQAMHRADLLLEGHGESPATAPLPSPASPHPYRIPVPEWSDNCFFVIQVPSAQAGNEMVTVGWWARPW